MKDINLRRYRPTPRKLRHGLAVPIAEPLESRVLLSGEIYTFVHGTYQYSTNPTGTKTGSVLKISATGQVSTVVSGIPDGGQDSTTTPADKYVPDAMVSIAVTATGEVAVAYAKKSSFYTTIPADGSIRRYNLATGQLDLTVPNVTSTSEMAPPIAVDPSGDIYTFVHGTYQYSTNPTGTKTGSVLKISATGQVSTVVSGIPDGGPDSVNTGNKYVPNAVVSIAVIATGEVAVAYAKKSNFYTTNAADGSIRRYNLNTGQLDLTVPNVTDTSEMTPPIAVDPSGDIYTFVHGTYQYSTNPAGTKTGSVLKISATGQVSTVVSGIPDGGPDSVNTGNKYVPNAVVSIAVTATGEVAVAYAKKSNFYTTNAADGSIRRYNLDTGQFDLTVPNVTDTSEIAPPIAVDQVTPNLLAFSGPIGTTANGTLSPVAVDVEDSSGALVTTDDSDVTLMLEGSSGAPAMLGGTTTVAAVNGVATFSDLSIATPGNAYTLIATDGNDASAISSPFSASLPPAMVFLGTSAKSVATGVTVTFTATLEGSGATPTGTVTFYDGSIAVSSPTAVSDGIATFPTSSLPVGQNSITAQYGGDSNYSQSTSRTLNVTVSNVAASVSGVIPASVIAGAPLRLNNKLLLATGSVPAIGKVSASVLLSSDETAADSVLTLALTSARLKLKDNKTASFNLNVHKTIPKNVAPGTYHILIDVTDTTGTVSTIDSGDSLNVVAPVVDLSGSFVKVPASITPGKKFAATVLITNLSDGNVPAVGHLPIEIQTSSDGQLSDATLVEMLNKPINLKPGKSQKITLTLSIDASTDLFVNLDPSHIAFSNDSDVANEIFSHQIVAG